MDFFIIDDKTGDKRLKRCDEHYRKFVTELWWSVRLAIESDQIRNLPEEVAREGYLREWQEVAGNRIEIESKVDMKERVGYSPDKMDWFVTCVEGARRKGFQISKLAGQVTASDKPDWLSELSKDYQKFMKERQLQIA